MRKLFIGLALGLLLLTSGGAAASGDWRSNFTMAERERIDFAIAYTRLNQKPTTNGDLLLIAKLAGVLDGGEK